MTGFIRPYARALADYDPFRLPNAGLGTRKLRKLVSDNRFTREADLTARREAEAAEFAARTARIQECLADLTASLDSTRQHIAEREAASILTPNEREASK